MYVYIIGTKEGVTSHGSLWVTIWVLGSFTKAVSTLNHRVTSPLLPSPSSVSTPQCLLLLFSVSPQFSGTCDIWGTFLLFLFRGTMSVSDLYVERGCCISNTPIKVSLSLALPVWRCVNTYLGTVKSSQWCSLISMLS